MKKLLLLFFAFAGAALAQIDTGPSGDNQTVAPEFTIDSTNQANGNYQSLKIIFGADQGGLYSFQSSTTGRNFVGLSGFESPSSFVRYLYFGGGGWGAYDANQVAFYTDADQGGGMDEGVLRMNVWPSGGVSIADTAANHFDPGSETLYVRGHIEIGYNHVGEGYITFYDRPDDGGQFLKLRAPTNITLNGNLFLPDTGIANDTLLSETSSGTLTNKQYDASATGNVLKQKNYIPLTHPDLADGTGATLGGTATSISYGRPTFSNSADQAANYVEYYFSVPTDVDPSVTMRAIIKFRLGGADTGTHRYVLSEAEVSNSADPVTAGLGGVVNLDFAGDASGANGDIETVGYATLTGWNGWTGDRLMKVRLARDGDAAQDTSTVDSTVIECKIEYGSTQ